MNGHFVVREQCPACESTNRTTLFESRFLDAPIREYLQAFYDPQGGVELDYLEGASFIVDKCRSCGLVYQRQIGDELVMHKLYEEWIDPARVFKAVDGCRGAEYFIGLADQLASLVRFFRVPPSQLAVLDFGMGWGYWCRMASAFDCKAAGVELSQPRIDYARANGITVLDTLDFADATFDFINLDQILEHVPEPLLTLKQLRGHLRPSGLLRVSAPNGVGIQRRLSQGDWNAAPGSRNSLNPVAPLEHVNCFTSDVLTRTLGLAGLQIVPMRELSLRPVTPVGRLKRAARRLLSGPPGELVFYARAKG
jgi:2-polyprenyl-3-methyl-5-hydroxy-6-metoxy-1,4-benzoquinol methylase